LIRGLVQGVGFRPFICRIAAGYGLKGQVDNRTNGVLIMVDGDMKTIEKFSNDILKYAPPASRIKSLEVKPKPFFGFEKFNISPSRVIDEQITEVSPDIAVCDECLTDMSSDSGRIDYPLINCTNCGPRFSIIRTLPYDRPGTTMDEFIMCGKCRSEYNDIFDRRFHAQPVACNECGPVYMLLNGQRSVTGIHPILEDIALLIGSGKTVAVKGTGGYHLMCDALNNDAVKRLRERKHRDSKPFAVMFADTSVVKEFCRLDENEERELTSWRRPIVLLIQKKTLPVQVNNGLCTIGAMLPYMPFHYLMFRFLKTNAVVMTSGNLSEEPVIKDDNEAEAKLSGVADAMVIYNRKIHNRIDDSVIQVINSRPVLIRRSRGYVPRPVDLVFNAEGILALGAEQKNSFCIGKNMQAIMSQYIGDLKNTPTCDFYVESIRRFSDLFRFSPGHLVCDLHPGYFSTQYASALGKELHIPLLKVQHHHAHIVSCMAENHLDEKVIGISLDGTGYGTDGNIWGSEFLIADMTGFERFTHFDYVPMPGGDKASQEPWRMAFSWLFRYFGDSLDYELIDVFRSTDKNNLALLREMIKNKVNSPLTSGAGRLFDAVSAIAGLCKINSFDSEAPMRLESAISCITDQYYPFRCGKTVIFEETFRGILDDLKHKETDLIPTKFHNTIARIILEISKIIRDSNSLNKVVLSGGVFQNRYLTEKAVKMLTGEGFVVFTNRLVPSNDGGISLGQIAVASKTFGICA
jgi:hydrogenase maturation protein HypF